jgi:hypothetical protein
MVKKLTKNLLTTLTVIAFLLTTLCMVFATDSEILEAQLGGSYSSIADAMGGQRHHCFAADAYSKTTVNKYNSSRQVVGTVTYNSGPCILMTTADHQQTASWGSSTAATAYRSQQLNLVKQGKYLAAMQMDIDDIHAKFGSRYNTAISRMWSYATGTLRWYQ